MKYITITCNYNIYWWVLITTKAKVAIILRVGEGHGRSWGKILRRSWRQKLRGVFLFQLKTLKQNQEITKELDYPQIPIDNIKQPQIMSL